MTDKQRARFYFPLWRAACDALGWRMERGRLVRGDSELGTRNPELRRIVELAETHAATRHTAPNLDDLRHAAHVVALGRDKSANDLSNAELDRVATLFRLLADPEDLDAVMKWQSYQRGEDPGAEERLDHFIKNAAPDAYVRHIAADKFGSRMWEWLTIGEKRNLALTLRERKKSHSSQPEYDPANAPF